MKIPLLLVVALFCAGSSFASDRAEKYAFARRAAADGIVLLENKDNALPLKAGEQVVLAGVTSYYNIRMGWGSGDMMLCNTVQYDVGLERAGIKLDADFAKLYRDFINDPVRKTNAYERINLDWAKWTTRFEEPDLYGDKFAAFAKGKRAQKCIVTIGRGAGESEDLKDAYGSFRLHWQEDALIKAACENFDTVIVLLNCPGVMDTSFMERYPIKALVFTGYLGEVAGDAVADILTGKVNPSGKTVDTWAKRYRFYPTTDCFGTLDIPYDEWCPNYGLFTGDMEMIRYPFGYGLSYTTFTYDQAMLAKKAKFETEEDAWKVSVRVTNTGKVAGAEVVQVYVDRSEVRSPARSLCAFAKTKVLQPGESEVVVIPFGPRDIARFFHVGDTTDGEAVWQASKGFYSVIVGNSAKSAFFTDVIEVKSDIVVQKVKRRFDGRDNAIPRQELVKKAEGFVKLTDVLAKKATLEDLVAQFTDEELVAMINGRILDGEGYAVDGGTGVGGMKSGTVACEGGEFWSSEKYGIPAVTCADGPSGVRLGNFGDPVTKYNPVCGKMFAWPCGTILAQGWDLAAAEKFGRMIAEDMKESKIDVWLAPGVNIHRNPLCGRNFEYFSEDPLLAGMMGAYVVRGVQTLSDGTPSGCIATVKHFCANNQEFCRGEANSIMISEKAFREIYLKPFEIAVKVGKPLAIMSSYNKVNDEYCATTYDLMTGVLREEWGFDGLVMTDWWNSACKVNHPAAGNDVVMPGIRNDYNSMLAALKDGRMKRADAQRAAVNVLKSALYKLSCMR